MKTDPNKFKFPTSQAQCDHCNALRDYEAAHKAWMNTSRWSDAYAAVKAELERTRQIYTLAIMAANPHISVV